jgi:hypothetical protein
MLRYLNKFGSKNYIACKNIFHANIKKQVNAIKRENLHERVCNDCGCGCEKNQ